MSWSSTSPADRVPSRGSGGKRSGYPAAGGGNGVGGLAGIEAPPGSWAGDGLNLWRGGSIWATDRGCCASCTGTVRSCVPVDVEAMGLRAERSVPASEVRRGFARIRGDVRPGGRLGRGRRDEFTSEFV